MIQLNSKLIVLDNSGAKIVKCIKITKGSTVGTVGDIIVVAVQKAVPNKKIKAGDVTRALIVCLKKEIIRADGSTLRFSDNYAILLNKKNMPLGTHILGYVSEELRARKYMKVISIAEDTI